MSMRGTKGSHKQDLITMIKIEILKGNIKKASEICDYGKTKYKTGFSPKDFGRYTREVEEMIKAE